MTAIEVIELVGKIIIAITGVVLAIGGLIGGFNHLIKESNFLANTIWDFKKYGFKRRKKNASSSDSDTSS